MALSKAFRCYVEYQKGTQWHPIGKKRKGETVYIRAMNRDLAIAFMQGKYVKPRKGEFVVKIVATGKKEDVVMNAVGAPKLPITFD